jgi:hypothetical protein
MGYWLSWLWRQGQLLLELDEFRHCWEIQNSSNGEKGLVLERGGSLDPIRRESSAPEQGIARSLLYVEPALLAALLCLLVHCMSSRLLDLDHN